MIWRKRPLYSACTEDTRSEIAALNVGPSDTVCEIAAGGGRVLSLLTAGPGRLIAIDCRLDQRGPGDRLCYQMPGGGIIEHDPAPAHLPED